MIVSLCLYGWYQTGEEHAVCGQCSAIRARGGLGGNVWKKRLDKNTKRGIVVKKVGDFWVFVYLFAKSERENIDDRGLRDFKKLARDFGKSKSADVERMLGMKELTEICNG